MPLVTAFHEIDTLAHGRFHLNKDRPPCTAMLCRLPKCINHLLHVIAVHVEGIPAKSLKFVRHLPKSYDILGCAIDLRIVAVADYDQIIKKYDNSNRK